MTDAGPATVNPNAALRAELRLLWTNRVPPHITTEVARRQFDPHTKPERWPGSDQP